MPHSCGIFAARALSATNCNARRMHVSYLNSFGARVKSRRCHPPSLLAIQRPPTAALSSKHCLQLRAATVFRSVEISRERYEEEFKVSAVSPSFCSPNSNFCFPIIQKSSMPRRGWVLENKEPRSYQGGIHSQFHGLTHGPHPSGPFIRGKFPSHAIAAVPVQAIHDAEDSLQE